MIGLDPVTCAVAVIAAVALLVVVILGIRLIGCLFTFLLVFLPALLGGFAAGYFYDERVGFSVGTIMALLMLLMARSKPRE